MMEKLKKRYETLHVDPQVAEQFKVLATETNMTHSELLNILCLYAKNMKYEEMVYINPDYKNIQYVRKFAWK